MSIITGAGLESFRKIYTAGTAYAIAELVDNAIQAKANQINIIFIERPKNSGNHNINEVLIIDNGDGMSAEVLETCLDFGGGTRHGATSGLGKYGIGLPYSSASQCPNYSVYTWQGDGVYKNFRNHLDYSPDEFVDRNEVEKVELPSHFTKLDPSIANLKSGTIVQWSDCDKLDAKTAKTVIKYIDHTLGRIYRYFLKEGLKINFITYKYLGGDFLKIEDLCREIKIFDPMFLTQNTCLPSPYNNKITNETYASPKLRFKEIRDDGEITHEFKINFSWAKEEIQDLGGNSPLGKQYGKVVGISLVRANRELKLDRFEFPFSQSEPRHRWWSCEVLFEAISDDLLGVSANKIDAGHFRYISDDDYDEHMKDLDGDDYYIGSSDPTKELVTLGNDPVFQVRKELSKVISLNIREMMKVIEKRKEGKSKLKKCPKCGKKKFKDGVCKACDYTSDKCPVHDIPYKLGKCPACEIIVQTKLCWKCQTKLDDDGSCPQCQDDDQIEITDAEKEELTLKLKSYDEFKNNEKAIEKTINWFMKSKKKQFIVFTDLHSPVVFVDHRNFQDGKFRLIEINTTHSFYKKFMEPIINKDDEEQVTPLLLFIASMIESEVQGYANAQVLERYRTKFGFILMEMIENWTGYSGI